MVILVITNWYTVSNSIQNKWFIIHSNMKKLSAIDYLQLESQPLWEGSFELVKRGAAFGCNIRLLRTERWFCRQARQTKEWKNWRKDRRAMGISSKIISSLTPHIMRAISYSKHFMITRQTSLFTWSIHSHYLPPISPYIHTAFPCQIKCFVTTKHNILEVRRWGPGATYFSNHGQGHFFPGPCYQVDFLVVKWHWPCFEN